MASNDLPTLMNIPLEVRHQIFQHVAKRDTKPEKLLRYWFEKKEVKEKTAELLTRDPNAGTPRVVFEGDRFEDEEREVESGDEEGDGGEEDSDEEHEDEDEDEEENEAGEEGEEGEEGEDEDEGDEAEEQDEEMADNDDIAAPAPAVPSISAPTQAPHVADTANQLGTTHGQQHPAAVSDQTATPASVEQSVPTLNLDLGAALAETMAQAAASVATEAQSATTVVTGNALGTSQSLVKDGAPEDVDADMAEEEEQVNDGDETGTAKQEDAQMDDEEEEDEESSANEDVDGDSDEDMEDEDENQDTARTPAQPPPPPAPVVTSHRKWRHIPKFMRITHCPPPVELFLTSKQLNAEAKNWFYDVAVLHVDATGSFAHTSFFEEALSQITEAAFSPMEDIRKVEVTFVWDSTWLRSDRADCAAAIFPALLRQRAIFVTSILAQAPNLSEVVIHWHDSAEDEEAVDLMSDVLGGFLGLDATVKVEPHYIAADAKPYRNSVAGKQRIKFGRIVSNGLDRLF